MSDSNAADWDHVNNMAEDGSFCHSLKWKQVLERTFGYQTRYFLVYKDDQPVALCPLYKTKIKWFSGLTTLPNSVYDHILVTDKQDSMIIEHALTKIKDLMKREEFSYATLGLTAEMKNYFPDLSLPLFQTGGNMVLNLQENPVDKIWSSRFAKKQRFLIRRFENDGFTANEIHSSEDMETFFRYYAKNIDYVNVGRKVSDNQPYPGDCKFERELVRIYKDEAILVILRRNQEIAGGALFLQFKSGRKMYSRILWPNRDLPKRYQHTGPTLALCWYGVRRAVEMGFSTFCFGDTPDNSEDIHYWIKSRFGAQFQRRYAAIFSESLVFSLAYNAFRFAQQHQLASYISRSGSPET
ncbi:MAG TPA: hypothetical protein VJZ03_01940 [Candidatus Bathyarchaeia archaeon]|nr:hypothetical protein [Candidatus Bathyarchaeia archaeon]